MNHIDPNSAVLFFVTNLYLNGRVMILIFEIIQTKFAWVESDLEYKRISISLIKKPSHQYYQ